MPTGSTEEVRALPELIHLNGPPGAGKSTLAAALVGYRPLALNLDIDELRTRLGSWQQRGESRQVARQIAFRMADWHLRSGNDVVVPQLLVRREVVDQLETVALDAGATFREVIVLAPPEACVERIRRDAGDGLVHPRHEFDLDELERRIDHSCEALARLAAGHPRALTVDAAGSFQETLRRLEAALA